MFSAEDSIMWQVQQDIFNQVFVHWTTFRTCQFIGISTAQKQLWSFLHVRDPKETLLVKQSNNRCDAHRNVATRDDENMHTLS